MSIFTILTASVAFLAASVAALPQHKAAELSARAGTVPAYHFAIHPNNDTTKCVGLFGRYGIQNDTPLVLVDCDRYIPDTWWYLNSGETTVKTNTGFSLDSGTNPKNNDVAKIYTSYAGLPAQTWYYTDDKRIALEGANPGLCLDLTNGDKTSGTYLQYYACQAGNVNQIWTTTVQGEDGPGPVKA